MLNVFVKLKHYKYNIGSNKIASKAVKFNNVKTRSEYHIRLSSISIVEHRMHEAGYE